MRSHIESVAPRSCLTAIARSWALLLLMGLSVAPAQEFANRGGAVQWARLKTNYKFWNRHAEAESYILQFIRSNTNLEIMGDWGVADLYDEKALASFPFVYAEGIQTVTDPVGLKNLREYLLRGGFLIVDACINPEVNPEPDFFYEQQVARFRALFPEVVITPMPDDHELYRCYFQLPGAIHTYYAGHYDARWAKHPLYAVTLEGRIIAVISLAAMKCGWTFPEPQRKPTHRVDCMKMMVNIYIYALTH